MRTSGTVSDPIAFVPLLVAVVAIVMLAGGPYQLLLVAERMLRSFADVLGGLIRLVGG